MTATTETTIAAPDYAWIKTDAEIAGEVDIALRNLADLVTAYPGLARFFAAMLRNLIMPVDGARDPDGVRTAVTMAAANHGGTVTVDRFGNDMSNVLMGGVVGTSLDFGPARILVCRPDPDASAPAVAHDEVPDVEPDEPATDAVETPAETETPAVDLDATQTFEVSA